MFKRFLAGAALAVMLSTTASARGRGVVIVRPSFGYGYGWGGGFYGPYWGSMYPYGYGGPYMWSNPNVGTLKVDTKLKDTGVYINGTYAGTVRDLKSMNLRPGSYNVELRNPTGQTFDQKIYIIAGKTLKLRPAW